MQHTLPVIGLVNSHYFLNQSDEKHNPIKTLSPTFSHTLGCLVSLTLSSHWLWKINSFLPISPGNCFSYGFMTLNWKVLYWKFSIKLKYTHQKQKQKKLHIHHILNAHSHKTDLNICFTSNSLDMIETINIWQNLG